MKLTRPAIRIVIAVMSLMVAGAFFYLKTKGNDRSLVPPKTRIGEDMRKMEPSVESKVFDKAPASKGPDKWCSGTKKEVFIDWRKLYWGNLGELTKPERFFASGGSIQTTQAENAAARRNEALQHFTRELRAALKAFEKRYYIKINWRKNNLTTPDVTAHFINFWDKGFETAKETAARDRMDTGGTRK